MSARIALLPDVVINQIAAGEVIERPASVVKELVENSIDAGARQVVVEMEHGGTRLIRVHDDGCGIARDELALALQRHATSKLRGLDDLGRLQSLGFRGEALPSIGSVSRLTLTSKTIADETAWKVSMMGAEPIAGPQPAARAPGTTVEVRELFHCVPARRRFLKTERTEFLQAQDWLRRTALARPQVDLSLVHNGQRVLAVRAAPTWVELPARVEKITGAAFMRQARRVEATTNGLSVHGWVAPADAARNQSDLQYWLVNGRPVRDPRLQHAVRLAYEDKLAPGRHAAFVLYLDIDPAVLDVNVHPAKTEVRFAEPRRVHDFVFSTVRRALGAVVESSTPAVRHVAEEGNRYQPSSGRRPPPGPEAQAAVHWRGEVLAELEAQLLLVRSGDETWLIDPAPALGALWAAGEGRDVRPLMFPASLPVDAGAAALLRRHGPQLRSKGIEIDPGTDDIARVRSVPIWFARDVQRLATTVLELLAADPIDPEAALEAAMAQIAVPAIAADRELAAVLVDRLARTFERDELVRRRIAHRLDVATLRQLLDDDG